jgi:hypothetical protein
MKRIFLLGSLLILLSVIYFGCKKAQSNSTSILIFGQQRELAHLPINLNNNGY